RPPVPEATRSHLPGGARPEPGGRPPVPCLGPALHLHPGSVGGETVRGARPTGVGWEGCSRVLRQAPNPGILSRPRPLEVPIAASRRLARSTRSRRESFLLHGSFVVFVSVDEETRIPLGRPPLRPRATPVARPIWRWGTRPRGSPGRRGRAAIETD